MSFSQKWFLHLQGGKQVRLETSPHGWEGRGTKVWKYLFNIFRVYLKECRHTSPKYIYTSIITQIHEIQTYLYKYKHQYKDIDFIL